MKKWLSTLISVGMLSSVASAVDYNNLPKGYVFHDDMIWMPVTFYTNWDKANSYCINNESLGVNGWRLPTRDELSSLYSSGKMKGKGWNLPGYEPAPWTSDSAETNKHYNYSLHNGASIAYTDNTDVYVTCVYEEPVVKAEKLAYSVASAKNSITTYKSYLKQYPNGKNSSSARSNIEYLEAEAQFKLLLQSKSPKQMYLEAGKQERNGNTSKATKLYEAIIDRFPNSEFAVKASDKLTGAIRAERAESIRRSQSRQECENNKNACLAGCGTYVSGADSHNNAVWSCNDKCKQISCY